MMLGRSTINQDVRLFTTREKYSCLAVNCSLFGDKAFCAWSHCSGSCGLPALTIKVNQYEPGTEYTMKAVGEAVAIGRAWLPVKPYWTGETVMIDDSVDHNELYERIWWL